MRTVPMVYLCMHLFLASIFFSFSLAHTHFKLISFEFFFLRTCLFYIILDTLSQSRQQQLDHTRCSEMQYLHIILGFYTLFALHACHYHMAVYSHGIFANKKPRITGHCQIYNDDSIRLLSILSSLKRQSNQDSSSFSSLYLQMFNSVLFYIYSHPQQQ